MAGIDAAHLNGHLVHSALPHADWYPNIGMPGADLLALVPGTDVERIERCSAFDGTWGMKKEFFALSMKYAGKLNRAIEDAEAAQVLGLLDLAVTGGAEASLVPGINCINPWAPFDETAWAS